MADEIKVVTGQEKEEQKETQKDEKASNAHSQIIIDVIRTPNGIDCTLAEDCMLPPNEIYIRGIFDKARDLALYILAKEKIKEAKKKQSLILPANSMAAGLKTKYNKIIGK